MNKVKLFDEKSGNPLNDNENRSINTELSRTMQKSMSASSHLCLPRKAKKLDKQEKTHMFTLFMYEALTRNLQQTLASLQKD